MAASKGIIAFYLMKSMVAGRWTAAILVALAALAGPALAQQSHRYAALIVDDATGKVLHAVNADAKRYPASLTKMMTLYMAFEAIDGKRLSLDQRIPVSAHAANQAPSRLGLQPGETIVVRHAILGLVTKSANDAAAALGEALGGTEAKFAALMTKRAQALGMTDTVFKNASGLPNPRQVTTARDMATLARALRRDFPHHYRVFATPEFSYKGVTHRNHNRLLGQFEGADGVKTGFIGASGFNLAASVQRGNRRIVGVVLGGNTASWRDARMMQLVEQAFNNDFSPSATTAVASAAPARRPAAAPSTVVAESRAARLAEPVLSFEQGDGEIAALSAIPNKRTVAPAANPGSSWAIQVGAFSRHAPAHLAATKAKGRLPKTLKSAKVRVVEGSESGVPLYRAHLTGIAESTARSACRQLEKKGVGCIVLPPSGLSAAG